MTLDGKTQYDYANQRDPGLRKTIKARRGAQQHNSAYSKVPQLATPYYKVFYKVLESARKCYIVLESTAKYQKVFLRTTKFYKVRPSRIIPYYKVPESLIVLATKCYSVLRRTGKYYKVLLVLRLTALETFSTMCRAPKTMK